MNTNLAKSWSESLPSWCNPMPFKKRQNLFAFSRDCSICRTIIYLIMKGVNKKKKEKVVEKSVVKNVQTRSMSVLKIFSLFATQCTVYFNCRALCQSKKFDKKCVTECHHIQVFFNDNDYAIEQHIWFINFLSAIFNYF